MPSVENADRLRQPPFVLRVRVLTPLDGGGTRYLADALFAVDQDGRIASVDEFEAAARGGQNSRPDIVDLRPLLLLPGLIDLHAHLPQVPNAGLGAGLELLTWLERYIFPLERGFDAATAARVAPAAYRAFASVGTTTAVLYGAVYEESLDVCFAEAERHGIRAVIGKVMMDRLRYDETVDDREVLEVSLAQSRRLIDRWHGRDNGRLSYAVTPRFAVSCTEEMLRRSAALATEMGTYWQTHLAEDRHEIEEVRRLFPGYADYTDVYARAGALGPRSIFAHGVYLSEREVSALKESGAHLAHCPSSNLFLASGAMPLARYLAAGLSIGLGSDVAGGPDLSLFSVMRAGAYVQSGLRTIRGDREAVLRPLDWLAMASLHGARALGIEHVVGSLEPGKEADFIAIDPRLTAPIPGDQTDDPSDLISRLIYRARPDMVRGAWVRGRRLPA